MLKGFSLIEVLVSMFLWTSFLYLFQSYQMQEMTRTEHIQHEMAHVFIIENVLSLYHLGFLPSTNIFFMNSFGYIASDGVYEIHQTSITLTIYYEGEVLYVYQKN